MMSKKTEQRERPEAATSESLFDGLGNAPTGNMQMVKDGEIPFTNYSLILGQLQRLDVAIHKEYTLVSDRMSWLVTSESFIFTAFIVAAVNYKNELPLKLLVTCILFLLPLLGIFLAAIVAWAINAAHRAAHRQKNDRDELEQQLPKEIRIKPISSKDPENHAGNLPPTYVPFVLIGVWAVLLTVVALTTVFRG